ncbi:MAG: hypothetical protein IJZ04_08650 [Clostridia bacterium]|nr:hypothetical protein [Clostridia bacterium]
MQSKIYCKSTGHDQISFYLEKDGCDYYMFTQRFKRSAFEYYAHGVTVSDALSSKKGTRDIAILKVMSKLPSYIRYIEREYGIVVLRKTQRRANDPYRKARVA